MTQSQHQVLKVLRDKNIGSTFFAGQWIFPEDIRNDSDLADRMMGLDWIKSGAR